MPLPGAVIGLAGCGKPPAPEGTFDVWPAPDNRIPLVSVCKWRTPGQGEKSNLFPLDLATGRSRLVEQWEPRTGKRLARFGAPAIRSRAVGAEEADLIINSHPAGPTPPPGTAATSPRTSYTGSPHPGSAHPPPDTVRSPV
ncbi:hypothetical protein ACFYW1_34790 [Streptomyces sp. NPDC002669]|uniref:hypothetical protein n=1 Tax=Streptomyces sp. NPDC002669 TaxID=3364658 RepID=UPI0036C979A8